MRGVGRRGILKGSGAGLAALGAAAATTGALVSARQAAAQSAEDSLLRTVLDRGHLIVGTGSTNAPWHFEDEGGKLVGMDITMARILAQGLFDDPRRSSSCSRTRRRASPTSPPARSTSSSNS
jgi:polar amino acid transport system substrate-binding protein